MKTVKELLSRWRDKLVDAEEPHGVTSIFVMYLFAPELQQNVSKIKVACMR